MSWWNEETWYGVGKSYLSLGGRCITLDSNILKARRPVSTNGFFVIESDRRINWINYAWYTKRMRMLLISAFNRSSDESLHEELNENHHQALSHQRWIEEHPQLEAKSFGKEFQLNSKISSTFSLNSATSRKFTDLNLFLTQIFTQLRGFCGSRLSSRLAMVLIESAQNNTSAMWLTQLSFRWSEITAIGMEPFRLFPCAITSESTRLEQQVSSSDCGASTRSTTSFNISWITSKPSWILTSRTQSSTDTWMISGWSTSTCSRLRRRCTRSSTPSSQASIRTLSSRWMRLSLRRAFVTASTRFCRRW